MANTQITQHCISLAAVPSPEVLLVTEVPCTRVTDQLPPILGSLQHRAVPERLWHRFQAEGGEELIREPEHAHWSVALRVQTGGVVSLVRAMLWLRRWMLR